MQEPQTKLWTRPFITVTLLNLLLFFGFQMLMPIIPLYLQSMGADDGMIGLIAGIFTISTLAVRPFAGMALDRVGKKQALLFGLAYFMVFVVSYSFLPSIGLFLLFRFLHGFGWGTCTTSTSTIVSSQLPKKRFAEGMGYFGLSSGLGMALGPATGLFLIVYFPFRDLTFLTGILVVIAFLMALTIPRSEMVHHKPAANEAKASLYERAAIRPGLIMMFVTITYGSIVSFLSLYAASLGIANIGIFYMVYAGVMLITRPAAGKIVDRYGFDQTVVSGLIFLAIALCILWRSNTLVLFLVAAVFYGLGFGTLQSTLQTMAVRDVTPNRLGAANATFFTGFDLGIGIGSMLFGRIALWIGYSNMYLAAIMFTVIAMILYFTYGKKPHTSEK